MKIAVIGAGAIGNLVAGYLKIKGNDVLLAGNPDSVKAIKEKGLEITGVRGDFDIGIGIRESLDQEYDLVILAVKTQDIKKALTENLKFLQKSIILTTQNGVRADNLVCEFIPKNRIISSIVMFGSTYIKPAEVVHNFEGSWIIGSIFSEPVENISVVKHILNAIFPVVETNDIRGMKYLKIFVNANNCIPAILGISIQEAFNDLEISRISIGIWKEGLDIITKSKINLVSLPDFSVEKLTMLASLPVNEAAKIFSGIMVNLSKHPLYGSILQSIKRGRQSEIDYINGEFVRIAKENSLSAPLNEKLVEMVHQVEKTGRFFSKEELILAVSNQLSAKKIPVCRQLKAYS